VKPLVTLRKAFEDPNLPAPVMGGASREPTRALLLASQGKELTTSERAHFRRLTARDHEPLERVEECHILAGRRSGKTSGCAALGVTFFMKQIVVDGRLATDKTRFPADLQIQEWPAAPFATRWSIAPSTWRPMFSNCRQTRR
jgi:hypothetical protein